MTRERLAEGIAHDLRRRGVPVIATAWKGRTLCMQFKGYGWQGLPTNPYQTVAELEAHREAALSLFLEKWASLREATIDRATGTCIKCGEPVEQTGMVYVQGRRIVCPSCYSDSHTAEGDGSQGTNP